MRHLIKLKSLTMNYVIFLKPQRRKIKALIWCCFILPYLVSAISGCTNLKKTPNHDSVQVITDRSNPKDNGDYWRNSFTELSPNDNDLANHAHEVFNNVYRAAGIPIDKVIPELIVIPDEKLEARVIPDGSIIISQGTIKFCYKNVTEEVGDARLSFILGHELAHLTNDDFRHTRFFHSLRKVNKNFNKSTVDNVKIITEATADKKGVVYSAIAGYNVKSLIENPVNTNFFSLWSSAIGEVLNDSHPSPSERAFFITNRLKETYANLDYFNLGLDFFQSGDYSNAILSFKKFLTYFDSREVYLNLGASYQHLAMKYYMAWRGNEIENQFPLLIPVTLDPNSLAPTLRAEKQDFKILFFKYMNLAKEIYEKSMKQDPDYVSSYINYSIASIMLDQAYEAIAKLTHIKRLGHNVSSVNNLLGVSYYLEKDSQKALTFLHEAITLQPNNLNALFNLGQIYWTLKKPEQAQQYWSDFSKIDAYHPWNARIANILDKVAVDNRANRKVEHGILGINVGDIYSDELPESWGRKKKIREIRLKEEPFNYYEYSNGIVVLTNLDKGGEVVLLFKITDSFKNRNAEGININADITELYKTYGQPTEIMEQINAKVLLYEQYGLSFKIIENKVNSWVVFSS